MRALLVLVLAIAAAACGGGGSSAPVDAKCGDAQVCGSACAAQFSGNFTDSSTTPSNCAAVSTGSDDDPQLAFSIESPAIGSPLAVMIDLGASPAAGMYSSETSPNWSAVQARSIDDGGCVYSAGTEVVPTGSFTLALTAIDATTAHGALDLLLTVHALEATNCGAASTETVAVEF